MSTADELRETEEWEWENLLSRSHLNFPFPPAIPRVHNSLPPFLISILSSLFLDSHSFLLV